MQEVYKNNDTRFSSDREQIFIPTVQELNPYTYDACSALEPIAQQHLTLNRYRATIHIPAVRLDCCGNILPDTLRVVSAFVSDELSRTQPIDEGNPVILKECKVYEQIDVRLYVIDLTFYATQMIDVDNIAKPLFERTLNRALNNDTSLLDSGNCLALPDDADLRFGQDSMHLDGHSFFEERKYSIDAEEKAHELLKTMLTEKEFEHYKLEGTVTLKGTYGRNYVVKRGDMISVTQELRGKKKMYRLCIEPRDRGKICPTDEVIAKVKLIRADEKKLHELARRFDNEWSHNGTAWEHVAEINGQTYINGELQ